MRSKYLFLLAGLTLLSNSSYALTCSVNNVQPVNFGSINPLSPSGASTTMTFNYTCAKSLGDILSDFTLCFNLGSSAVNGQITPRNMSLVGSPASLLNYQLYQDSGYANVWGSQSQAGTTYPIARLTLLDLIPVTRSLTVYARVPGTQISASPGSYQDSYSAATAYITVNSGLILPTTCGTTIAATFPFTVNAQVTKQCNINYTNNINLGLVSSNQVNINGNNTIGITCSNRTPYTVGLIPSNNNTLGLGVMKSSGSNTVQVPYQLRSSAGISGTPWGNITSNYVSGIGTGSTIAHMVYVTLPSANYIPDSYSDTVTINVTY